MGYSILLILLLLPLSATQAETVIQNDVVIHYQRKISGDKLALDIRPINAKSIEQLSAHIDGVELPVSRTAELPSQHHVILFLVDTSDPRRQQAVDSAVNHINQLLDFRHDHYRYALARFDSELHFLTSIGVDAQTIQSRAHELRAQGKTTELYRNMLSAINQLARYPAQRKFLFLFSDGRAEDQAYFHHDVVRAANKSRVSLYTIGYADTDGLTVYLQTLRRLSEDTGGRYFATQPGTYLLQPGPLRQFFDTVDAGAQFQVDLAPILQTGVASRQRNRTLSITIGGQHSPINLPLWLPSVKPPPPSPVITEAPASSPSPALSPKVIIERTPSDDDEQTLFQALLAILILLSGLIIYLAIRLRTPKSHAKADSQPPKESSDDIHAWLEYIDNQPGHPRHFPIRLMTTKIGRHRDNDITLRDSTISRYHAEIYFANQHFTINDLNSKNGILVNGKEVTVQNLEDGDIVECGDIQLRFLIAPDHAEDTQETQIFKTQLPNAPA